MSRDNAASPSTARGGRAVRQGTFPPQLRYRLSPGDFEVTDQASYRRKAELFAELARSRGSSEEAELLAMLAEENRERAEALAREESSVAAEKRRVP
jgi:hypothetical protein